ncbi:hypothetical protein FS749_009568, partial [Ceratobasidium sp. UAMH 11750]
MLARSRTRPRPRSFFHTGARALFRSVRSLLPGLRLALAAAASGCDSVVCARRLVRPTRLSRALATRLPRPFWPHALGLDWASPSLRGHSEPHRLACTCLRRDNWSGLALA